MTTSIRNAIALVLIFPCPAFAALSCIEVGEFVEQVAVARDQGRPEATLKRIIREDAAFTANEKRQLTEYATQIFSNPDIPPRAMANLARETCYRPGKR